MLHLQPEQILFADCGFLNGIVCDGIIVIVSAVNSGTAPTGYYNAENGKRLGFVQNENGSYNLAVVFSFIGAGINLTNDINVIWELQVPDGYTDIYATFKLGDDEVVIVTDYTITADGKYRFVFLDITPNKMGDKITASVYADGELRSTTSSFCIRNYCERLLTEYSSDAELVAAVSDLLIYGEKAQIYVGYKTDALITDGLNISASESPVFTKETNKLTVSKTSGEGIGFEGIGLILDSSLAFRLAFSVEDAEGMTLTVTIGNRAKTFNVSDLADKNGKYLLVYDGINATQFDSLITVSFAKDGTTLGTSLTYSVNSYVYYIRGIEAEEKLSNLVEAVARYGASAVAYSKSHAE